MAEASFTDRLRRRFQHGIPPYRRRRLVLRLPARNRHEHGWGMQVRQSQNLVSGHGLETLVSAQTLLHTHSAGIFVRQAACAVIGQPDSSFTLPCHMMAGWDARSDRRSRHVPSSLVLLDPTCGRSRIRCIPHPKRETNEGCQPGRGLTAAMSIKMPCTTVGP